MEAGRVVEDIAETSQAPSTAELAYSRVFPDKHWNVERALGSLGVWEEPVSELSSPNIPIASFGMFFVIRGHAKKGIVQPR